MKVLLLAGTSEARALARRLDRMPELDLTVSLAGVTERPMPLVGHVRRGGFGGGTEQADYMRRSGYGAVIDATHPFAANISLRTQRIAHELGLPYLQVLRPAWRAEANDDWCEVASLGEVAGALGPARVVFLGTGPGSVDEIGPLHAERVICRRIDPTTTAYPHENGGWQVARPPFSVSAETAFFQDEGVEAIVAKNSGGDGGWAKLGAARNLGLPVVMVARPEQPPGDKVSRVEDALDWLGRL